MAIISPLIAFVAGTPALSADVNSNFEALRLGHNDQETQLSSLSALVASKQTLITGAATTVVGSNLSPNRVVVSNATGKIVDSAVTSTELANLSGISGNIQDLLDEKLNKNGDIATGNLEIEHAGASRLTIDGTTLAETTFQISNLDVAAIGFNPTFDDAFLFNKDSDRGLTVDNAGTLMYNNSARSINGRIWDNSGVVTSSTITGSCRTYPDGWKVQGGRVSSGVSINNSTVFISFPEAFTSYCQFVTANFMYAPPINPGGANAVVQAVSTTGFLIYADSVDFGGSFIPIISWTAWGE